MDGTPQVLKQGKRRGGNKMVDYGRDLNIGIPTMDIHKVNVENFASVIATLEKATSELEEMKEELRKITLGAGLILGQEIEEA